MIQLYSWYNCTVDTTALLKQLHSWYDCTVKTTAQSIQLYSWYNCMGCRVYCLARHLCLILLYNQTRVIKVPRCRIKAVSAEKKRNWFPFYRSKTRLSEYLTSTTKMWQSLWGDTPPASAVFPRKMTSVSSVI